MSGKIINRYILLVFILIPIVIFISLRWYGNYVINKYLYPYNVLLNRHVNSTQAVEEIGYKPWYIFKSYSLCSRVMKNFPVRGKTPPPEETKTIMIYAADPFGDGDGAVTYLFFNKYDKLIGVNIGIAN